MMSIWRRSLRSVDIRLSGSLNLHFKLMLKNNNNKTIIDNFLTNELLRALPSFYRNATVLTKKKYINSLIDGCFPFRKNTIFTK